MQIWRHKSDQYKKIENDKIEPNNTYVPQEW